MHDSNFIGSDGAQWPSVTEVLAVVSKAWMYNYDPELPPNKWGWYPREVYKAGWEGWLKCWNVWKAGCDYGTAAHTALETWDLSNPAAKMIYEQFCPKVTEFVQQEVKVISKQYRYHGTADFICYMDGYQGLFVGDWKTSNTMTDWYMVQMAAYAQAWNEEHPDQMIDQAVCVHYDKKLKTPKLKVTYYRGLKDYFKAFISCREVLDYDRQTGPWRKPDYER